MINKKSLKNLNPGIEITWNGQDFNSISELARHLGMPESTVNERLNQDKDIQGFYADYK